MNAKWFVPLALIGFAGFVIAAKAYLSRIPQDVEIPPSLAHPERIYAEYVPPPAPEPSPIRKSVFRPRPRSLEPLPVITTARPAPELEPMRPDVQVALATAKPLTPEVPEADSQAAPSSAPTPELSGPKSDDKPAVDEPVATSEPAVAVAQADETRTAEPLSEPIEPKSEPPPVVADAEKPRSASWSESLNGVAESLDDAAVRLRSNLQSSTVVRLTQGYAALQSGRFDEALADFDGVLVERADQSRALSGRAEALIALGRFDDASKTYERLLPLTPGDTTARYNAGVVLYRLSRFSEASEQFRALVKIDPDHAEGQYNLATLSQRDGRLAEALDAWRAFTRLRPAVAGGWFNLGIVLMDYDRPTEAVECFQKVVELDHNDADAHINLAMAFMSADRPEEALKALEIAEQRLPGDRVVLRYLADVHGRLADAGGPDGTMHRQRADQLRARMASSEPKAPAKSAVAGEPKRLQD